MYSNLQLDLTRLALYAYDYRRQVNRTGIPEHWVQIKVKENPATGFQAYAFLNTSTNQVAVSFTGTRFHLSKGKGTGVIFGNK